MQSYPLPNSGMNHINSVLRETPDEIKASKLSSLFIFDFLHDPVAYSE